MKEIKDSVVQLLNMDKCVVLYGNPGILSFHAQYHLFKNTRVFTEFMVPYFFMATLFMNPHTLKFEITINQNERSAAPNSDRVLSLFVQDGNLSYARYLCESCVAKRGVEPKPANVDEVVNILTQSIRNFDNDIL